MPEQRRQRTWRVYSSPRIFRRTCRIWNRRASSPNAGRGWMPLRSHSGTLWIYTCRKVKRRHRWLPLRYVRNNKFECTCIHLLPSCETASAHTASRASWSWTIHPTRPPSIWSAPFSRFWAPGSFCAEGARRTASWFCKMEWVGDG